MTARLKACRHKRGRPVPPTSWEYVWWCKDCGAWLSSHGWIVPGAGYEASLRRALRRKQRKEKAQ